MFAVKHSPFDMIPQVIKRGEDDTKRPASVMRKEPNDVMNRNQLCKVLSPKSSKTEQIALFRCA